MFELLVSALIWSTTPIFAKIAYVAGANPLSLVEIRLITASAIFALVLKKQNPFKLLIENLPAVFALSVLGLGANFYLYHTGLEYTSAGAAQVLESTSPIFALLLATALGVEKFSLRKLASVFVSFLGIVIIFHQHINLGSLRGDFLELLAGVTWAIFTTGSALMLKRNNLIESLFSVFLISFFILLPFSAKNFTPEAIPSGIFMGVVHTSIAYLLYLRGIRKHSPVVASLFFTLSPVFTLILSRGFLGEMESVEFYAGSVLVVVGIALALLFK